VLDPDPSGTLWLPLAAGLLAARRDGRGALAVRLIAAGGALIPVPAIATAVLPAAAASVLAAPAATALPATIAALAAGAFASPRAITAAGPVPPASLARVRVVGVPRSASAAALLPGGTAALAAAPACPCTGAAAGRRALLGVLAIVGLVPTGGVVGRLAPTLVPGAIPLGAVRPGASLLGPSSRPGAGTRRTATAAGVRTSSLVATLLGALAAGHVLVGVGASSRRLTRVPVP